MKAECRFLWLSVASLAFVFLSRGRAAGFDPSEWTEPTPLSEVNSIYDDKAAFLSFDGLTLYLARSTPWQYARIYEATRESPDQPFGMPWEVSGLNSANANVDYPWVSADNLRMYYYSTESNRRRLRLATRSSATAWWLRGSEIPELNDLGGVANPTLTEDELTIVFSGSDLPGGKGGWDLWMAGRPDRESNFENVTNLAAVNGDNWDMHPHITPDGLTLYFASNRGGAFQIFESTRPSLNSPFEPPRHIAALDTPDGDSQYPRLSPDGKILFVGVWPKDQSMDIYVSYKLDLSTDRVRLVQGNEADGSPWASSAFATIHEAVAAAEDGDTLLVNPGVHREAIDFLGKAITIQSAGDAAVVETPGEAAVSFHNGEGRGSVLRNLILRNSRVGISLADGSPTITNVTVVGNETGVEALGVADPHISNSIFWANIAGDLFGCAATYSCIERGGPGEGNFSDDPLFVDPENGDYHLRSTRGRYWPEHDVWVLDSVTSPCIDAGDPGADFSREPKPNGNRLNVGAHGGTAFAERSEPPFSIDVNGDGLADAADLELFLDLWEQQTNSESSFGPVRR